ncbi:MAG TPA: putative zinc-binding metallopeptidase [Microlunatus sp.]
MLEPWVGLQLARPGGRTCGPLLRLPAHQTPTRPRRTVALERFATTEEAKRRLILQLGDLGLPIVSWDVREGGLGFDLLSSLSNGQRVIIGHANGIISLDLAESLDDHREALRVRLGEPYRTMLGHLRHEVGHYYQ